MPARSPLTRSLLLAALSLAPAVALGQVNILAVSVSPSPITGSVAATGTVTLEAPAPTGGVVVTLASSDPTVVSVPATITINATLTTGTFSVTTFVVTVTQSVVLTATSANSKTTTLTVNPKPTITTASLPTPRTQGITYPSTTLLATGGTGAYTWALAPGSGLLPTGLGLSSGGEISGIPTAAGTYSFTVRVTDAVGGFGEKAFSVVISPPPSITTASPLPPSTQGVPYSQTLLASGGTGAYTWSATGLPAWLALNPTTGVLANTSPTVAGIHSFTVRVTDSQTAYDEKLLSVTINPPLSINPTPPLPSPWTQGWPYPSTTLTASGGTGAYTWLATGLPSGLTLNPVTGNISGTPLTSVGSPFTITVTVTDAVSATANRVYTVAINPALTITGPASLPAAIVESVYPGATMTATGGTGGHTWSAIGLPPGLGISPSTGAISGTPTTSIGSPFSVTVTVTDSIGATTSQGYSLAVSSPTPTITSLIPSAAVAGGLGFPLTVNGSNFVTGAEIRWNGVALLPTSFSPTQLTAPVPAANIAAAGPAAITVANPGPVVSDPMNLTIIARLTVTTSTLPSGSVGAAYAAPPLQASGGTYPPYTWSLAGVSQICGHNAVSAAGIGV